MPCLASDVLASASAMLMLPYPIFPVAGERLAAGAVALGPVGLGLKEMGVPVRSPSTNDSAFWGDPANALYRLASRAPSGFPVALVTPASVVCAAPAKPPAINRAAAAV